MKSILMATILGLASLNASAALMLSPGDADFTTNDNSNLTIAEVMALAGYSDLLELYYKDNVGGSEEGPFATVYGTAFSNTPTDPADFLIQYIAGDPISCPDCFLLVKDGNQDPAQYLFNIDSWNGTDDIMGTGFWPDRGAISNVALFGYENGGGGGGGGDPIPEPGTALLMGVGLLGLGAYTRRKRYTI